MGKKKKIELIYAGLRVSNDSVFQCFVEAKDVKKEYFWTARKWVRIGGVYHAEKNGKVMAMLRRPEHVRDEEIDKETLNVWEAHTLAAEEFRLRKRQASRALGFEKEIERAVAPLRDVMRDMSFGERRAFGELVAKKLSAISKGDRVKF